MPNGSEPDPSSRWVVISLVKMVNSKTVNRLCLQFSLTTQSASQVWIHSFTNISWADGCGDLTGCHLPIRRGAQTSAFVLSDAFCWFIYWILRCFVIVVTNESGWWHDSSSHLILWQHLVFIKCWSENVLNVYFCDILTNFSTLNLA